MGLSVFNQVDNKKYFSISTINKLMLEEKGISIPVSKFKAIVRKSPPHMSIATGSDRIMGRCRRTNIYRYEDFLYLAEKKQG